MNTVKRWLAGFLSFALIFTSASFGNLGALSVYADEVKDENIQAVLEYGTTTGSKTYDNIKEAITAADQGAVITVTGTINEIHLLDVYNLSNNYTLDCSGATISDTGKIALTDQNPKDCCLTSVGNIYRFFPTHKYTQASATAVEGTPENAQVVLTCANGGESKLVTVTADKGPDTIGGYKVYRRSVVNGKVPLSDGTDVAVAFTDDITWKVEATAGVVTYTIEDNEVSYVQDGNHVAIKDANGNVQFYATYYADSVLVLDDNGDPVRLIGTGKKVKGSTVAPDYDNPGYSDYDVEFTTPDNKKHEFKNVRVFEADKLKKGKKALVGIQLKIEKTDGSETKWTDNIFTNNNRVRNNSIPSGYQAVTGENGEITFRWVYSQTGEPSSSTNYAYGEEETHKANATNAASYPSKTYVCGAGTYYYGNIVKNGFVGEDGTVSSMTVSFTPSQGSTSTAFANVVAGVHDYDNYQKWAKSFTVNTNPSHTTYGYATATCYCGETDDHWVKRGDDDFSQQTNGKYRIPKSSDHEFEKDASGVDKVYTVKATCTSYGFQYKKCTFTDKGWTDDNGNAQYKIYLGNNHYGFVTVKGKTASELNDNTNGWHPVLVEGSASETFGPHKYYVQEATFAGVGNKDLADITKDDDVICTTSKRCMYEGNANPVTVIYHKITAADYIKNVDPSAKVKEGTTDTIVIGGVDNIFGAITPKVTPGKDCTKGDTFVYELKDVFDADGNLIASDPVVSTQYFGPHTYKNEVAFTGDAKSAYVIQQCTKSCSESTIDYDGNKKNQQKKATVTGVDNSDGSTTYTATLEGFELTNNTITVFDLSKATITVNGGEDVDLNTINSAADFKDLVEVKINGVAIKESEYEVVIESNGGNLAPGNNKVTVKAAANKKAVDSQTIIVKCVKLGQLQKADWFVDGISSAEKNFEQEFVYDGSVHTVSITVEDKETRAPKDDVTVKYAVVYSDADAQGNTVYRYAQNGKKAADSGSLVAKDLSYDLDKVELSEAKTEPYLVFAQMSAEEYTTAEEYVGYVDIYPADKKLVNVYIDNASVIEGNIPNLHVRVLSANGADQGQELNVDLADFTIKTVGGEDLTNLKVGSYQLIATSEKYYIKWDSNQITNGHMGTLTVLSKDDSTAEEQAAAESVTALINALNENSTEADVKAARAAYDKLSDVAKKRVDSSVLKKLTDAEDKIAADKVVAAFNKDDKVAAYDAYSKLTDAQKKLVDAQVPAEKITEAKKAYDEKKAEDDKKAAEEKAAKELADAKTAATTAINGAKGYESDAAVKAAIDELNKAVAANNTAAIKDATAKLNSAVAAAKAAPQKGKTYTVGGQKYYVSSATAVKLAKAKNKKTVTVPATVTIKGKKLNVTGIKKKAFGKKTKTVKIKTKKLTKKGVKNSLKGSKVKTVKVPKSSLKKYKKYFTKKNCGKKVTVKK